MNEKIVIDVKVAMELLRKARSEKGYGYVDPDSVSDSGGGCRNVKWVRADGEPTSFGEGELVPSCIVGHVLFYAGVDIETLATYSGAIQCVKRQLMHELGEDAIEITTNAEVVLLVAQRVQDDGKNWGAAVDRAAGVAEVFMEAGVL